MYLTFTTTTTTTTNNNNNNIHNNKRTNYGGPDVYSGGFRF
jgi:hypothetical protein